MNILYISPYRNISTHNECMNNIHALSKSASLTVYPIYTDPFTINNKDKQLSDLENQNWSEKNYDAVLQHAPINYLLPFKNIAKHNYCIPIIDYDKQISKNECEKLLQFDTVLVDSKYDLDYLNKNINQKDKRSAKQIKLFKYVNNYTNSKYLNLTYHKNNYKIYTFVNHSNAIYIKSIILSFFIVGCDTENCSLIISVQSEELANKVKSIIEDVSNRSKIAYVKNYIKILVLEDTIENSMPVHQSCDCYIGFRSSTNHHFHPFLARELNNAYITNDNMDMDLEPLFDNKNIDLYRFYPEIKVSKLVHKIKNLIRTKPIHKEDNISTIDNIICR
jgi:hypothetical protein